MPIPDMAGLFSGMVFSQTNCSAFNTMVPYVKETNSTTSEEIYEALKILNEGNFSWGEDIPNNEMLPDGGVDF
jgi:hypothetical protein